MKVNIGKARSDFINGELWLLKSVLKGQRAFLIVVPKIWIKNYCRPDATGHCYVGYRQQGDEIVIKAYRGDHDSH
jgi:hypothetical protein